MSIVQLITCKVWTLIDSLLRHNHSTLRMIRTYVALSSVWRDRLLPTVKETAEAETIAMAQWRVIPKRTYRTIMGILRQRCTRFRWRLWHSKRKAHDGHKIDQGRMPISRPRSYRHHTLRHLRVEQRQQNPQTASPPLLTQSISKTNVKCLNSVWSKLRDNWVQCRQRKISTERRKKSSNLKYKISRSSL